MADSQLHPVPFTGSQRLILHLSQEELAGTRTVTGVPEGRIQGETPSVHQSDPGG